jgi:hypothetical protein
MARLSLNAMNQRDSREELTFAIGSAEAHLNTVELRVAQAQRMHGLDELMDPAMKALNAAKAKLARVKERIGQRE